MSMNFDPILALSPSPYSLASSARREALTEYLRALCQHHFDSCPEYKKIINFFGVQLEELTALEEVPFLPISLFKDFDLMSIPRAAVFKTMLSSGTSGQAPSRIFLDRRTAAIQSKILAKIMANNLGSARFPMIIFDSESTVSDRKKFSARAAGINGFSAFSKSRIFALRQDMSLDVDLVRDFLRHHDGSHILAFGFTFIIWKHVFQSLINSGEKLNLDSCLLLHGGGWKNLAQDEVTPEFFKNSLFDACGIRPENVREYYGMVEQTGSIHMECPHGRLHSSVYGDIFVRRPDNFDLAELGQTGVIQVLTSAASSYPGQSLLTEDEGVILGEDDCPCGRLGKTFKVIGRLKQAETRGCSDTYAESILRN